MTARSPRVEAAFDEVLATVKALPYDHQLSLALSAQRAPGAIHPALRDVYRSLGRVAQAIADDTLEAVGAG